MRTTTALFVLAFIALAGKAAAVQLQLQPHARTLLALCALANVPFV